MSSSDNKDFIIIIIIIIIIMRKTSFSGVLACFVRITFRRAWKYFIQWKFT